MNAEIKNHINTKRKQIALSIQKQTKVYLDTKYWIKLRDQNLSNNLAQKELLTLITELVDSGVCIFPVSETIFWEILKQQDKTTLLETIKLVDKLSKGIAILNSKELVSVEFFHLYSQSIPELHENIWTKSVFVTGDKVLAHFLAMAKVPLLQKSFYDFISTFSLVQVISVIDSNGGLPTIVFKDDINRMNADNVKHAHENDSYEGLFLSELNGLIECNEKLFLDVIAKVYESQTGKTITEKEESEANFKEFRNFLLHGFKLGNLQKELASLVVHAKLHAAHRDNKFRKFKDGNDTMDFFHASFALPYFDYFFTEKRLANLIQLWKIDEFYSCSVLWKEDDVINSLKLLKPKSN